MVRATGPVLGCASPFDMKRENVCIVVYIRNPRTSRCLAALTRFNFNLMQSSVELFGCAYP